MPDYAEAHAAIVTNLLGEGLHVKAEPEPGTGLVRPETIVVDAEQIAGRACKGLAAAGLVVVPYFRAQPQLADYQLSRAMVSANLATLAELRPDEPPGEMNDITNELLGECTDPYAAVAVLIATVSHLVNSVAMHYDMDSLAWWQVYCEQATRDEEDAP